MVHVFRNNFSADESCEEGYISAEVLDLYKGRLIAWRAEIIKKIAAESNDIRGSITELDVLDVAQHETDIQRHTVCVNQEQWLLSEIDAALVRIGQGEYGYCEVSGEPIGLRRLDCWPIARLSIKAQQIKENQFRLEGRGGIIS